MKGFRYDNFFHQRQSFKSHQIFLQTVQILIHQGRRSFLQNCVPSPSHNRPPKECLHDSASQIFFSFFFSRQNKKSNIKTKSFPYFHSIHCGLQLNHIYQHHLVKSIVKAFSLTLEATLSLLLFFFSFFFFFLFFCSSTCYCYQYLLSSQNEVWVIQAFLLSLIPKNIS